MSVILYYNPHCSKSQRALQVLREHGVEPVIVEYLTSPPSKQELSQILQLLGMEPRDLMRKDEPEYREANLDDPGLTRDTLIIAMVQRPKLIQRPILLANGKAILGRPPEKVLEIL
jgi:arsenate reductase (glutaredoxin)